MKVNGTGDFTSKAEFGDGRLHVEFATPVEPKGVGQDRGNCGVFLMGRYEIRVFDNWKVATYADGMDGALCGQKPPSVDASRPPGEWQTCDITFTAPRFDEKGSVLSPARVTVLLNGVKVQDDFKLLGPTGWRKPASNKVDGPGPVKLQNHGHPAWFRNIWFAPGK